LQDLKAEYGGLELGFRLSELGGLQLLIKMKE